MSGPSSGAGRVGAGGTPGRYLIVDQESALVAVEGDPLYRGCLDVDTDRSWNVSSLRATDRLQIHRPQKEAPVGTR